jgi:hypothetical protein
MGYKAINKEESVAFYIIKAFFLDKETYYIRSDTRYRVTYVVGENSDPAQ